MIFNLYKQRGETPLECLQRFRKSRPDLKEGSFGEAQDKWTYLGRLDPMADGVMLVANGEDLNRREEFLGLGKEYDFVALFGFATDTYDILGTVNGEMQTRLRQGFDGQVIKLLPSFEGEKDQKYPPYSSKPVNGKPLFQWAREGRLDEVEIPTRKVNIKKLEFKGLQTLSPKELLGRLLMDISKVKGDFRQHVTLVLWKKILLALPPEEKLVIGKFSAEVSSGTYVRGIVNDLGVSLGIGACALSITRTRVGDYTLEDSIR